MVASYVSAPSLLQTAPNLLGAIGTVGLFALFLSVTAHLAARNVVGDVSPIKALGVGIGPAVVAISTVLLSVPGVVGVLFALAVDGVAIHLLYEQSRRTSVYITAVHAIVSVLLGTVLIGGLTLVVTLPG